MSLFSKHNENIFKCYQNTDKNVFGLGCISRSFNELREIDLRTLLFQIQSAETQLKFNF